MKRVIACIASWYRNFEARLELDGLDDKSIWFEVSNARRVVYSEKSEWLIFVEGDRKRFISPGWTVICREKDQSGEELFWLRSFEEVPGRMLPVDGTESNARLLFQLLESKENSLLRLAPNAFPESIYDDSAFRRSKS